MGTFHIGCRVENVTQRSKGATIHNLLVDTGSVGGVSGVQNPRFSPLGNGPVLTSFVSAINAGQAFLFYPHCIFGNHCGLE